jgi:hypothetical protein
MKEFAIMFLDLNGILQMVKAEGLSWWEAVNHALCNKSISDLTRVLTIQPV